MYVIRYGQVYYRGDLDGKGFLWIDDPFSATQFDTEATAKLTGDKLGVEYEVVELRSLINDAGKSAGG